MNLYEVYISGFDYYYYHDEKESNPEKFKKFEDSKQERLDLLSKLEIDEKEFTRYDLSGTIICTNEKIVSMMISQLPIKINKEINISGNTTMHEAVQVVAGKEFNVAAPGVVYNELVQVHMPGQALSTYNQVLLLENDNSCSDNLQSHLDSGWRIIAACPQPDSRRPDYILGRFNPEHEVNSSAKRPAYR